MVSRKCNDRNAGCQRLYRLLDQAPVRRDHLGLGVQLRGRVGDDVERHVGVRWKAR